MEKEKTIFDVKPEGTRDFKFKGKFDLLKDIAIKSSLAQLEDPRTLLIAGGIGLYQGLKYKGNFKLGVKAGLSTVGVMVGVNIINNIIGNIDEVKKA